jgi:hypothetical protein
MKGRILATMVALSFSSHDALALTVTDGDFSSWVPFSLVSDDPAVPDPGPGNSAGTAARVTSGGNPGAYYEINHTFTTGDRVVTGGIKTDFEYDPATEGPLQNFSVSASLLHPPRGSSAWQLVIEQDGRRYYSYPYAVVETTAAWVNVRKTNLTARNFDTNPMAGIGGVVADGRAPNLTATGSRIRFGFAFGNTVANGTDTLSHQLGMDSFLVTTSVVPTVSIAATQPTGAEAGESPQFTIAIDAIQKTPVVVKYKVKGTAKNGVDYKKLKGQARIKPGSTAATITIQVSDDAIKESAETITLKLEKAAGYKLDGAAQKAQAIIVDND